jgi:hypothetical protein
MSLNEIAGGLRSIQTAPVSASGAAPRASRGGEGPWGWLVPGAGVERGGEGLTWGEATSSAAVGRCLGRCCSIASHPIKRARPTPPHTLPHQRLPHAAVRGAEGCGRRDRPRQGGALGRRRQRQCGQRGGRRRGARHAAQPARRRRRPPAVGRARPKPRFRRGRRRPRQPAALHHQPAGRDIRRRRRRGRQRRRRGPARRVAGGLQQQRDVPQRAEDREGRERGAGRGRPHQPRAVGRAAGGAGGRVPRAWGRGPGKSRFCACGWGDGARLAWHSNAPPPPTDTTSNLTLNRPTPLLPPSPTKFFIFRQGDPRDFTHDSAEEAAWLDSAGGASGIYSPAAVHSPWCAAARCHRHSRGRREQCASRPPGPSRAGHALLPRPPRHAPPTRRPPILPRQPRRHRGVAAVVHLPDRHQPLHHCRTVHARGPALPDLPQHARQVRRARTLRPQFLRDVPVPPPREPAAGGAAGHVPLPLPAARADRHQLRSPGAGGAPRGRPRAARRRRRRGGRRGAQRLGRGRGARARGRRRARGQRRVRARAGRRRLAGERRQRQQRAPG